jgi:hypothetical protein
MEPQEFVSEENMKSLTALNRKTVDSVGDGKLLTASNRKMVDSIEDWKLLAVSNHERMTARKTQFALIE